MDPIKEAFNRAKQDVQSLKDQIEYLKNEIESLKNIINSQQTNQQTDKPTNEYQKNTYSQESPTHKLNELYKKPLEGLKTPISEFSTGNGGVPTDRQTNQQTDRHINISTKSFEETDRISHIEQVSKVLDTLDSIKKDLRIKFKKLTNQEFLIFSTIYQLEIEGFTVDYSILSKKLSLSESSIRDYTLKIIRKGVPLEKTKENNKKIYLSIPPEFKRLASLQTLIQLREI